MPVTFDALAHQVRQDILTELRARPCTVTELVDSLGISQPLVSKHLRILREAGFVAVAAEAQKRWYRLRPEAFIAIAQWLEPYRWMWEDRLDLLGNQLDHIKAQEEK